ncbi:MAG: Crp/Fnr family transcriptional regulator [Burkholderiaceae bacterium]|jgi:CRP-like cAMP-binding protein|nr:Crp/Fnr family transcriptional regulator [Burkholderiaceae bacterium]
MRSPHCLLGQMPEPASLRWLPHIRERGLIKGEVLQAQGFVAHEFQVIKLGFVLALRRGDDGVARPIALFGNGHAMGSPGWLQLPSAMYFQALGPGRICCVDIAGATRQGLVDAGFVQALAISHAHGNALLAEWARIVRIPGVLGQLAATLLQLSRLQSSLLVRLPGQGALAALLATTRETIARSLHRLARLGALERRDRWHCTLCPEALRQISGGQAPDRSAQD